MSDEITFPPMKGSGSSVAAFAIGTDGSTLAVVPNGDTVVSFINMRDEIERLRARVEALEAALKPFAKLYLVPEDVDEEERSVWEELYEESEEDRDEHLVFCRDIRAARAALKEAKP
jgi:hypothetical protein